MSNEELEQDAENKRNAKASIGNAITTWAAVEDELCKTFCSALTVRFDLPAIAAFFAIRSFEGKLSALEAAITSLDLPDIILDDWKRIYTALRTKNKKRNKIAHCSLLLLPHLDYECRIFPFFSMNTESTEAMASEEPLDTVENRYHNLRPHDIDNMAESFYQLSIKVREFNTELSRHLSMPSVKRLSLAQRI